MKPFAILITTILCFFIAISVHVYRGSGLFAGLFSFTVYYLAWELTVWRLKAIMHAAHPEELSDPMDEVHITTEYLKADKQKRH